MVKRRDYSQRSGRIVVWAADGTHAPPRRHRMMRVCPLCERIVEIISRELLQREVETYSAHLSLCPLLPLALVATLFPSCNASPMNRTHTGTFLTPAIISRLPQDRIHLSATYLERCIDGATSDKHCLVSFIRRSIAGRIVSSKPSSLCRDACAPLVLSHGVRDNVPRPGLCILAFVEPELPIHQLGRTALTLSLSVGLLLAEIVSGSLIDLHRASSSLPAVGPIT